MQNFLSGKIEQKKYIQYVTYENVTLKTKATEAHRWPSRKTSVSFESFII